MKLTLKLLVITSILFGAIYAATPLWSPLIVAGRLPPGWQLEKLETGYPGISGIDITMLRLRAQLQAGELALAASDIRIGYHGLKTEIDSILLDVFVGTVKEDIPAAPTLDDLTLPITRITATFPELTVRQMRVALHNATNTEPGYSVATMPVVMDLQALNLQPGADNDFHLSSNLGFEDGPGIVGRLEANISKASRKAEIRFPANSGSAAWLSVSFEQTDRSRTTDTMIRAVLDTGSVDGAWLNPILERGTGGFLTELNGKLDLQAQFAGPQQQGIEHLAVVTENLQAEIRGGTLDLDTELLAIRDGEKITVSLPTAAEFRYRDKAGEISGILKRLLPGLQRTSAPFSMVVAELGTGSNFVFQTGNVGGMVFRGGLKAGLASSESRVNVHATDFQMAIADLTGTDSLTANGLISLNWVETAPFAYTSGELDLKAANVSLSSTGNLHIAQQKVDFRQTGGLELLIDDLYSKLDTGQSRLELTSDAYSMQGRLDLTLSMSEIDDPLEVFFDGTVTARHPVISLPGDEQSAPLTINANELSITAGFKAHKGNLVSTGSGAMDGVQFAPLEGSAARLEGSWRELDLLSQSGSLGTRTRGFAVEIDGKRWTDFDFDVIYTLFGNADIGGSGTVTFKSGPQLPIEFTGNTQARRWNVKLPASDIKMQQMREILRVGHIDLPTSVKLSDGYITIAGDVEASDEITANVIIIGHQVGASMLESRASEVSFTLDASYDGIMTATGPVSIGAATLAGGVDMANVRADLEVENTAVFGLKNLYAEVFDGQLRAHDVRLSASTIDDTMVELTDIDLARVLAFVAIDGLEGTGRLDISLPAGNDEKGVHINNGTFSSTGPGRLAFTRAGLAGSNIGLQALENFQYQELSGSLNYQSDGDYRIEVHLEGKNPDFHDGYPIVLNLNLSGFLPELFEALFMTGSFEESILKEIKSKTGGG